MKRTTRPYPPSGGTLFQEPDRPANVHIANVDGASRGNPGPAAYGLVLRAPDGHTAFEVGKYIGRTTNNVAEYYALISALDYAAEHRIERLLVRSDSELLVRQMQGRYKVKSPDLQPLFERAQKLSRGFAHFAIEHVRRELNSRADELANIALDSTSSTRAPMMNAPSISGSAGISGGASRSSATPSIAPAPNATSEGSETRSAIALVKPAPKTTDVAARRIRARFSAGALHPLAALDLAEGEIVEIEIKKSGRS